MHTGNLKDITVSEPFSFPPKQPKPLYMHLLFQVLETTELRVAEPTTWISLTPQDVILVSLQTAVATQSVYS